MSERPTFKVLSWNVSEKKADISAIYRLLYEEGLHDTKNLIACLQEVPARLLGDLQALAAAHSLEMQFGLDKRRLQKDGATRDCYLVILSQLPIIDFREWQISDTTHRPWISNVAIWLLRKVGKWDDTAIASGALSVTIPLEIGKMRIITAHLSLTDPRTRRREFDSLLAAQCADGPTIYCGDFNILQGMFGRLGNFLIGGSIPYAVWRSERNEFDEKLRQEQIINPLYGNTTHAAGQLDHIVYGPGIRHIGWKVFPKGASDHSPVSVTFQF